MIPRSLYISIELFLDMRAFRTLQTVYRDPHLPQDHIVTGKNGAIPSSHRDCFRSLPGQLMSRLLRRVTPTNFIAVPLCVIFPATLTR
jgi:hypothetical protein